MVKENSDYSLDRKDRKILAALQENAQLTNADLADLVGLSPSPCLRRVKRLEDEGYIQNYQAKVDRERLGYPITAFVQVALSNHDDNALGILEQTIRERPEIINAYLLTGTSDYLLHVVAKSLEDYTKFLRQHITSKNAVQQIQTSFALQTIAENKPIPI